jgi:hypothetical protein
MFLINITLVLAMTGSDDDDNKPVRDENNNMKFVPYFQFLEITHESDCEIVKCFYVKHTRLLITVLPK